MVQTRTMYEDELVFLCACVWVEMRKATLCKVDDSLKRGDVKEESQCECGAGQKPNAHCKYVTAVLYGLVFLASLETLRQQ